MEKDKTLGSTLLPSSFRNKTSSILSPWTAEEAVCLAYARSLTSNELMQVTDIPSLQSYAVNYSTVWCLADLETFSEEDKALKVTLARILVKLECHKNDVRYLIKHKT